jgi:hypothetical protein
MSKTQEASFSPSINRLNTSKLLKTNPSLYSSTLITIIYIKSNIILSKNKFK